MTFNSARFQGLLEGISGGWESSGFRVYGFGFQ